MGEVKNKFECFINIIVIINDIICIIWFFVEMFFLCLYDYKNVYY